MNVRSSAAVFAILVGLGMIGLWVMLLVAGQVPELANEPARISLHLAAEFSTALVLLVSGYLLLARRAIAERFFLVGLGMLLYTVIQSSGYYIQLGQLEFVGMFAVLAVVSMLFVIEILKGRLVST
jgi:hypothetical protein